MMPPLASESKAYRYVHRSGPGGRDWAVACVMEAHCALSVFSDLGRWCNTWPDHGEVTALRFLARLDSWDYLCDKLTRSARVFDGDATLLRLYALVADRIKCKARAARQRERLRELFELHGDNPDLLSGRMAEDQIVGWIVWHMADRAAYGRDPACEAFCKDRWPHLREQIAADAARQYQPKPTTPEANCDG